MGQHVKLRPQLFHYLRESLAYGLRCCVMQDTLSTSSVNFTIEPRVARGEDLFLQHLSVVGT